MISITCRLKMNAVSLTAWNQWMLSLKSDTVEHSPGVNLRSIVGLMMKASFSSSSRS